MHVQVAKQGALADLAPLLPPATAKGPPAPSRPTKGKQQAQDKATSQTEASGAAVVPHMALLFPSALSAADAKAVQAQEAALELQVWLQGMMNETDQPSSA